MSFEPGPQNDDDYVICPYCGHKHGDAWEWAAAATDGEIMDCEDCDRAFRYTTNYSVDYNTEPMPEDPV